jgi:type VI secretion system protein ImpA
MPTGLLLSDDLLDPIAEDQPAGTNLRWFPEWDRIKEARQSEDGLQVGKWAKKDPKAANWPLVHELTATLLRTKSKDLQLAMWLTEANVKLQGFAGLRDGFRLVRELTSRFWDTGLYPPIEDGPEDRTGPFEWLNDKLVDSVLAIPITRRSGGGEDYSVTDLRDARLVGSEKQCENADGEVDPQKKREYDKAVASGRISLEMYKSAVKETGRVSIEEVHADFEGACEEFKQLERTIEEKFGDAAPNLSEMRSALHETREEISKILEEKRREEPGVLQSTQPDNRNTSPEDPESMRIRLPVAPLSAQGSRASTFDSWQKAESLVRSGQVEAGLAEMRRLAANETTGRNRFQRKLLLSEICLASHRDRLARAVLEELAEQIEKHQLETWESSELISGVWTRLYELYRRGGSSDSEEAVKLFGRLCRLDPWQALVCGE